MSKVFIIGPRFHNFNISIARAFEELGWSVVVEDYDTPVHPFKGWVKWKHKFSFNKKKLRERQKCKYKSYIKQRFIEESPELTFVLNGEILHADTLDFFRSTSKVVLWMFDSITNIPTMKDHIDYVDFCFCYDQEDVDSYEKQKKKAYFLPQAYDPLLYYPKVKIDKEIDILFVGNLYFSKRRQQYLKQIIASFPDKKILVFGEYKPWYKNPIKWLFRENRNIYTNKNIPYDSVNDYYNRSRVVLNIHHEQQKNGANPKVFEIAGSGSYQVCDSNLYITNLFPNNEVSLYSNIDECVAQIENALKSDTSKLAALAQKKVNKEHTFKCRIENVLDVIFAEIE